METLVDTDLEDEEATDSEATVSASVSVPTVQMNDTNVQDASMNDSLNDVEETPVVVEETNVVNSPWWDNECMKTGLGRHQFYCPKNPNKITVII